MDKAYTGVDALSRGANRRLADYIAKARYGTLPPGVKHAFKRARLDYLACAVAGSRQDDDPKCDRIYPGRRSGVARLTLKNGATLEKRVLDPKGEGENQMTDEDLAHKFRSNCEPIIGKLRCDDLLNAV